MQADRMPKAVHVACLGVVALGGVWLRLGVLVQGGHGFLEPYMVLSPEQVEAQEMDRCCHCLQVYLGVLVQDGDGVLEPDDIRVR